jgi:hypothetical protein
MKIQHRVMLSATITIFVMFTAFTYLYANQSRALSAAHGIAAAQTSVPSAAASEQLTQAEQALSSTRRILIGLTVYILFERALAVFGLVGALRRKSEVAVKYVSDSASGDLRGELNTPKKDE